VAGLRRSVVRGRRLCDFPGRKGPVSRWPPPSATAVDEFSRCSLPATVCASPHSFRVCRFERSATRYNIRESAPGVCHEGSPHTALLLFIAAVVAMASAGDQKPAASASLPPKISNKPAWSSSSWSTQSWFTCVRHSHGPTVLRLKDGVVTPSGAGVAAVDGRLGTCRKNGDAARITDVVFQGQLHPREITAARSGSRSGTSASASAELVAPLCPLHLRPERQCSRFLRQRAFRQTTFLR